jgi:peptidoglycan/LPS O-acetylase OafA/YrhL
VNVRADRFPLMDSLRAIAALLVVGSHAALFAGMFTSPSPMRPYTEQLGGAGVTVFFLISGFLLYRPFVRASIEGKPWPSTGAYAWRRFLRIVPAYWVALTGVAIWLSLTTVVEPAWHVPLFYGFGQIYTAETGPAGLGQAWTLCVEVTFYAFLPLWALAMRGRGARAELVALAALWLAGLGWKVFATRHADPAAVGSAPWLQPLPNFIDQFAVGMALAVLSVRGLPSGIERAVRRGWPWWLLAVAAFWAVSDLVGLPRSHHGTQTFLIRHELLTVMAVGLLVPAIFAWQRADRTRRLLAWRPLLYVGLVSYGLYLWHHAVVFKFADALTGWMTNTLGFGVEARFTALFVLGAAGGMAIAAVSYYAVERPLLSLKRLVGPAPEPAHPGEAITEPAPTAPIARS